MRRTALTAFGLALTFMFAPAANAAPPDTAQVETDHLLSFIGASNCEFYRNGTWYTGVQAQVHMHEKLALLSAREQIRTAEEFIDKVATKSAFTGLRYQIRCGGGDTIAVDYWLRQELQHYRQCAAAANRCVTLAHDAPENASSR